MTAQPEGEKPVTATAQPALAAELAQNEKWGAECRASEKALREEHDASRHDGERAMLRRKIARVVERAEKYEAKAARILDEIGS